MLLMPFCHSFFAMKTSQSTCHSSFYLPLCVWSIPNTQYPWSEQVLATQSGSYSLCPCPLTIITSSRLPSIWVTQYCSWKQQEEALPVQVVEKTSSGLEAYILLSCSYCAIKPNFECKRWFRPNARVLVHCNYQQHGLTPSGLWQNCDEFNLVASPEFLRWTHLYIQIETLFLAGNGVRILTNRISNTVCNFSNFSYSIWISSIKDAVTAYWYTAPLYIYSNNLWQKAFRDDDIKSNRCIKAALEFKIGCWQGRNITYSHANSNCRHWWVHQIFGTELCPPLQRFSGLGNSAAVSGLKNLLTKW